MNEISSWEGIEFGEINYQINDPSDLHEKNIYI